MNKRGGIIFGVGTYRYLGINTFNFNVSSSTVNRIINSFFKEHLPSKYFLPEALCFDENFIKNI